MAERLDIEDFLREIDLNLCQIRNSIEFEAPWTIFAYLTPSVPAKKLRVFLAVDK